MSSKVMPQWLGKWMQSRDIDLWGVADLRNFATPSDATGQHFPFAISWAMPMNPLVMATIQQGPNQAYADLYASINTLINETSVALAGIFKSRGWRSMPLAASERTHTHHIKGDFPHKSAATRAGIGWIGRHCQLITRPYGSWARLGTVFCDVPLPNGSPMERSYCGRCMRCVDACPANALTGKAWHAGLARKEILDVRSCDQWKKQHYFEYHNGHNCGICSAVCPYGLKFFKRRVHKDPKSPT